MSNCRTIFTANELLSCSQASAHQLKNLLRDVPYGEDGEHGFSLEISPDGDENSAHAYLFAEDGGDPDMLPEKFLQAFGAALKVSGKEFLEVGFANTADKMRVGSHGGGSFRIYQNGKVVYPTIVWPK